MCHQRGVVHRDLKLENVLFETQDHRKIKVVDFGIAGIYTSTICDKNDAATLKYMTPEMILNRQSTASPAMDVWAIGIMLFCMIFNKFPFSGASKDEIKQKITGTQYKLPNYKLITREC